MKPRGDWLLTLWSRTLPPEMRDALLGDLRERAAAMRARGEAGVGRWLLRQVLGTPHVAMWRHVWSRRRARGRRTREGGRGTMTTTNLRTAVRSLLRRPGFAGVAILTLAMSTGAATLVFSLVEGVLLRGLPYPEAGDLYRVHGTNTAWRDSDQELFRNAWDRTGVSREMVDVWSGLGPVRAIASFQPASQPLTVPGRPAEPYGGAVIGHDFFGAFAMDPILGRVTTPAENASHAPVLVLHESLWTQEFGRDPDVIGKTVTLGERIHTVIGVMPHHFGVPEAGTRWWAPFGPEWSEVHHATVLSAVARLSPETRPGLAAEALTAAVANVAAEHASYATMGARIEPLRDDLVGPVAPGLRMLFASVVLVALIACVNLTNLVVARGVRRLPELALRSALGAGRAGIIGPVMTEVALLCLLGAGLGIGLAASTMGPLIGFMERAVSGFPEAAGIGLNVRVLAFTVLLTVATALLAGLGPALAAARRAPQQVLQSATRGSRSLGVRRAQGLLLAAEAALAMVLLAGAGLLTRSTIRALTVDPGFDPTSVSYATVSAPRHVFTEAADVEAVLDEVEGRIASAVGDAPLTRMGTLPAAGGVGMRLVSGADQPAEAASMIAATAVGPGYFEALSIPLVRGRGFLPADDASSEAVAVLSESLARRLFGAEDPVGRLVTEWGHARLVAGRAEGDEETSVRVVGVARDVRQLSVLLEPAPVMYRPIAQNPTRRLMFAWVTPSGSEVPFERVRAAVAEVGGVVLVSLGSHREAITRTFSHIHVRTALMGALSGLAALLAMVGVYGVVSFVVSDQTREIGIRIALGSPSAGERSRMVVRALVPIVLGAIVGLAVALPLSASLESVIFGVSRLDPATYAATFALLVTAAATAAWLPARRASAVDPVRVLAGD